MTYERGVERLRELHATARDEILAPLGDLGRYIVEFAYGEVWSRPGLNLRDREIATVSMLMALGRSDELRTHFGMAIRAGLTPDELDEIVIHSILYGGFPTALEARRMLDQTIGDTPRYRIRPETVADRTAIHTVQEAAFGQPGEARLVDALRAAGKANISLVAAIEDRVVGHVLFSPVRLGEATGLGLAPIAVEESVRRHGIGAGLVRRGLILARQTGAPFVVVLGDPAYYGRFGFNRASDHSISNTYGADEEFRIAVFDAGAITPSLASYAAEFDDVV